LTYEEYLELPEMGARYDIVDGELIMAPAPTVQHQIMLRNVFLPLHQFVTQHQLGQVLFAPLDILIQRSPLRTRQPDVLFVSNERALILKDIIEGAPDLIVEVLSPSNTRADIESKLVDYASIGVLECWLVSPEARTVEVLTLSDGNWQRLALHGLGDQVHSNVLVGLVIPVVEIFA
jgi:Uma2 family endonuclease